MGKSKKSNYLIESVIHALDLLEAYRGDDAELGVTELSKRLGSHKNNVFRVLATLESHGYIEQNQMTGNYRLGLNALELGQVSVRNMGLLKMARPVMEEIAEKCNENTLLGVVRGGRVVYVEAVELTRPVRVTSRVGMDLPVYCSAVGKVQVAYESTDEVERIFSEQPIERYTPRTITDHQELFRHLEQVRQQGYALDDEECEEEIRCVGAPVKDYTGRVVAGVSISGPAYRMTDERLRIELIPLVMEAGSKMSARLGYGV